MFPLPHLPPTLPGVGFLVPEWVRRLLGWGPSVCTLHRSLVICLILYFVTANWPWDGVTGTMTHVCILYTYTNHDKLIFTITFTSLLLGLLSLFLTHSLPHCAVGTRNWTTKRSIAQQIFLWLRKPMTFSAKLFQAELNIVLFHQNVLRYYNSPLPKFCVIFII